jgi:hypothetical protein
MLTLIQVTLLKLCGPRKNRGTSNPRCGTQIPSGFQVNTRGNLQMYSDTGELDYVTPWVRAYFHAR